MEWLFAGLAASLIANVLLLTWWRQAEWTIVEMSYRATNAAAEHADECNRFRHATDKYIADREQWAKEKSELVGNCQPADFNVENEQELRRAYGRKAGRR